MSQSQIINMTYKVYYAPRFVSEVERILKTNTETDTVGTSERVMQVAFWIEHLLLFIQRTGSLADMSHYRIYGTTLIFDTNIYNTGIGEIIFTIYYDNYGKNYVIYITDVNWNHRRNPNGYYALMYENKKPIDYIITEIISGYLRDNLLPAN